MTSWLQFSPEKEENHRRHPYTSEIRDVGGEVSSSMQILLLLELNVVMFTSRKEI